MVLKQRSRISDFLRPSGFGLETCASTRHAFKRIPASSRQFNANLLRPPNSHFTHSLIHNCSGSCPLVANGLHNGISAGPDFFTRSEGCFGPRSHWTPRRICPILRFVPTAPKNAGHTNPAKTANLPFEEALKKLEAIVEAMESDDLPLEALLAKYEEGTQLAKVCQDKLAEAELKIQQLEKAAEGDLKLKPLPAPAQT